jgi:hypothetical protein
MSQGSAGNSAITNQGRGDYEKVERNVAPTESSKSNPKGLREQQSCNKATEDSKVQYDLVEIERKKQEALKEKDLMREFVIKILQEVVEGKRKAPSKVELRQMFDHIREG